MNGVGSTGDETLVLQDMGRDAGHEDRDRNDGTQTVRPGEPEVGTRRVDHDKGQEPVIDLRPGSGRGTLGRTDGGRLHRLLRPTGDRTRQSFSADLTLLTPPDPRGCPSTLTSVPLPFPFGTFAGSLRTSPLPWPPLPQDPGTVGPHREGRGPDEDRGVGGTPRATVVSPVVTSRTLSRTLMSLTRGPA